MTLDDETARRIVRETVENVTWSGRYVELVRAGYAARDAEVEELRATLAKVQEYCETALAVRVAGSSAEQAQDAGLAAVILREALDESPTERETPADEWVYSVGGRDSDGSVWSDGDGLAVDIDEAREWVEEALESGTFANACLVRRRKAGPWEVVPDGRA